MNNFFSRGVAFSSVLVLMACSSINPVPMGRGYSSYKEQYKSAPGVPARDIGYDFTVEDNQDVIEDMRMAAEDLVTQLESELAFDVGKVVLMTPAHTAFYNGFDHVLREALTAQGYVLTNNVSEGTPVYFVALDPNAKGMAEYEVSQQGGAMSIDKVGDTPYKSLRLALALDVKNSMSSRYVEGVYYVPSYDFKPAGSVKLVDKSMPDVIAPVEGSEPVAICDNCAPPM